MHGVDWTMSSQEQSSYASDDDMEDEEESPVKKLRHLSNEGLAHELFSQQLAGGPGPLRLNLTKSPSFVELMQRELAQAAKAKAKGKQAAESSATGGRKLTTCHFEASNLRIGDWEWKSTYKGELVAKFYFAKNKIVWEIIHEGLKYKMEIKNLDISALKITRPDGLPGTLEITVSREPKYFREISPRPRRCTTWIATTDFTNGQAGTLRHVLHCDPGIIDKHIENLFCKDQRLYLLSQENTTNLESPSLEQWYPVPEILNSWIQQDSYPTADGYQFGTEQFAQPSSATELIPTGTTTGGLNLSGNHHGGSSVSAPLLSSDEPSGVGDQSNSDMFSWDNYFQRTSATTAQPFTSNGGNSSGKVNHINNQMSSGSSHRGLDVSSSRVALPEVIRRNPDDGTPIQPVEPVNRAINAGHGVLFPSSVPAIANTAAIAREPSGRRTQAQLTKDMFDWKSFLQTPPEMDRQHSASDANAGIMNSTDTGNLVSNQINPGSLHSSGVDQSSSRMVLPVDNSRSNEQQQQVNPWSFHSSSVDQSSSRMVLLGDNSMNNNQHQQQVNSWSFQSSGVDQSSSKITLPGDNSMNNNHHQKQQVNSWSFQSSGMDQSSRRMTLPGDNSMNNNQQNQQQVSPWSFPSSDVGKSSSRMTLLDNNSRDNNQQQQVNPWSFPSSDVGQSSSRMALPDNNTRNINQHQQQVNPWSFPSSDVGQSSSRMALPEDNSRNNNHHQQQQEVNPWSFPNSGVGQSSSRMALPDDNNRTNNHHQQQQVNRWSFHSCGVDQSSSLMALPEDNSRSNNQHQQQANPLIQSIDDFLFADDDFNGSSSQTFLPVVDSAGNPQPMDGGGGVASPDPAVCDEMCRELMGYEEAVAVAFAVPAEEEGLASTPNSLSCFNGQPAAPSAPSSSQSSSSLQANDAAQDAPPTQVTDAARSGSRSGDGWFPPLVDWPSPPW